MLYILARAVIIAEQHLLVAKAVGASNTFLPGGHVEVGESMPATLERELLGELGLAVKVERYLSAIEHSYGSPEEYEINHVFVVKCEYEPLHLKKPTSSFCGFLLRGCKQIIYCPLPPFNLFSIISRVKKEVSGLQHLHPSCT